MIGVTVGVGSYRRMAETAAASMTAQTGLKCIILDEHHMQRAGIEGKPASWLRLWLWNFVQDEKVLWFDADTKCLRKWNPEELYDGESLVVCRDWSWRDGIRREAESVEVPDSEYFLASVMLLKRSAHEPMLRLAQEILPSTSGNVYEQTALNAARWRIGIPMRWIDRRYNWSLYGEGDLAKDSGVIVAHYNSDALRCASMSFAESAGEIDISAFENLGDVFYRYARIGHDERTMFMRRDGTIGSGGGNAERFWFVRQDLDGAKLVIGSETHITCELSLSPDGIWRGAWLSYERMLIELERVA